MNGERLEAMWHAYRGGMTFDEVGRQVGLSGVRVSQLLRAAGYPTRDGGATARKRQRARAMHDLYAGHGLTLAEVGRRFGVSEQRVHQVLLENGYRTRGRDKSSGGTVA